MNKETKSTVQTISITAGAIVAVFVAWGYIQDSIASQAELDVVTEDIVKVQKQNVEQYESLKEVEDERYQEYKVNEGKRDVQIEEIKKAQTEQKIEQVEIKSQTEQTLRLVEKIYEEINQK